jgi:hypothetical protein
MKIEKNLTSYTYFDYLVEPCIEIWWFKKKSWKNFEFLNQKDHQKVWNLTQLFFLKEWFGGRLDKYFFNTWAARAG